MSFSDGRSYRIGEWNSISNFPEFYRGQCLDQIYEQIDRKDAFISASFVHENHLPGDSVWLDFEGFECAKKPVEFNKDDCGYRI